jgi:germination protein YpeB
VELSKAMLANTHQSRQKYYTRISRQAELAETNLAQLPLAHPSVDLTMKYVNQLGDYTAYLADNEIPLSDALARENLTALKETGEKLNRELAVLGTRIAEGQSSFTREESTRGGEVRENSIADRLSHIQQTNILYPKLIYDGPFSENSLSVTPKTEREPVTAEQARIRLANWLGCSAEALVPAGEVTDDYEFTMTEGDRDIQFSVTKKGGCLRLLMDPYTPKETKLTLEECRDKALTFGREVFGEVTAVWTQEAEHIAIINLTPKAGEVILYPDMIKVKVAMDTGKIILAEASDWINNLHSRTPEEPAVSLQEARAGLNPSFAVEHTALTLIPTVSGEKLCHEFQGLLGEEFFILYVNALTGEEEAIFRVLDVSGTEMLL